MKAMMDETEGLNPEFYSKYDKVGDKPLGTGLFSTVWRVKKKNDSSGNEYAAKEFNDHFNTGYGPEIGPLRLVNHPNIVHLVEDLPNDKTGGVIVLDLIEGKVLKDYLLETKGTLIPKKQLFTWFVQMADALCYCSEEIFVLHTDTHSENWRIREDN
jgi:serine/threonine protein kinase